jgi:hypothetical protein
VRSQITPGYARIKKKMKRMKRLCLSENPVSQKSSEIAVRTRVAGSAFLPEILPQAHSLKLKDGGRAY